MERFSSSSGPTGRMRIGPPATPTARRWDVSDWVRWTMQAWVSAMRVAARGYSFGKVRGRCGLATVGEDAGAAAFDLRCAEHLGCRN